MKRAMIGGMLALALVGCATTGQVRDTGNHVQETLVDAAGIVPAVVEDATSIWDATSAFIARLRARFSAPDTNAVQHGAVLAK